MFSCCFNFNIKNENDINNIIDNNEPLDDSYLEIPSIFNTPRFDLSGHKIKGWVKSVYDGDTIHIIVPIKMEMYEFIDKTKIHLINSPKTSNSFKPNKIVYYDVPVRLFGIDTPELKPKLNAPHRNETIEKAKKAREFLSSLVLDKIIIVEFMKNDKYGRALANLFIEIDNKEVNITSLMIEKGLGTHYLGGTKEL
jgi:endonuclease YncB( thermonuclease family)